MLHRSSYIKLPLSPSSPSPTSSPSPINSLSSLVIFTLMALLIGCFSPSSVFAEEMIYQVYLNEIDKGALFVFSRNNSIYLMERDVSDLGLSYTNSSAQSFEGLSYISLTDITGITYRVDPDLLEIHIMANPELLPLQSIDLSNRTQKQVLYPQNQSFFLNYGASYFGSESLFEDEWQVSLEAGYRKDRGLFLTDGYYRHGFQEDDFIRLQTSYILDDRDRFKRYTFGDQITPTTNFGSRLRLGGIGVSRNFSMDPYAVSYPTVNISGLVERPSEIKVYLDGQPISTTRVDPGRFELINLNRYGGAGEVELVIRDAYGREERVRYPFYISDSLLKRHDQTYSYHIGLEREQYGQESFDYDDAILSGYHLYGVSDNFTAGGTVEMLGDHYRVAPTSIYKLRHYGVVQAMLAASSGPTAGDGYAGAILYDYRRNSISAGFQYRSYSENYSTLSEIESVDRKESTIGVRGGLSFRSVGSFSYDYLLNSYYGELPDTELQSLSYNRPLGKSVSLFALLRKETGSRDESAVFVNLTWTPMISHQASIRSESFSEGRRDVVSFSKNTPTGRGYGYRVEIEKDSTIEDNSQIDLTGNYHGKYGDLSAGIDHYAGDTDRTDVDLHASGALVWIGKRWRASRPVNDSFALIKIGDIDNVRIYRNAEMVARTDDRGEAVVPGLNSFYHNRISFDDRDVPMEYQFSESGRYISPPYRSGSCLGFAVNKVRPVVGTLSYVYEGKSIPLEFREIVVEDSGKQIVIETGRGGEFYLDRSSPDKVRVETRCDKLADIESTSASNAKIRFVYTVHGESFEKTVALPETELFFMEVGDVVLTN